MNFRRAIDLCDHRSSSKTDRKRQPRKLLTGGGGEEEASLDSFRKSQHIHRSTEATTSVLCTPITKGRKKRRAEGGRKKDGREYSPHEASLERLDSVGTVSLRRGGTSERIKLIAFYQY